MEPLRSVGCRLRLGQVSIAQQPDKTMLRPPIEQKWADLIIAVKEHNCVIIWTEPPLRLECCLILRATSKVNLIDFPGKE